MDPRLLTAVHNNACWCDTVCRSHGIATVLSEQLWIAPESSPRLYPDAVTLVPRLASDVVLGPIDTSPGCSVKDSFADLDLSAHGFIVLFDAQWIFRAPITPPRRPDLGWQLITSGEDLQRWAVAADLDGIVRPELIRDPTVRVLGVRNERRVTAGAIINRTVAAAGVSNVFGTAAARGSVWRDLPAAVSEVFAGVPIVGYERGSALAAATETGFEPIAPLRVWLKPGG